MYQKVVFFQLVYRCLMLKKFHLLKDTTIFDLWKCLAWSVCVGWKFILLTYTLWTSSFKYLAELLCEVLSKLLYILLYCVLVLYIHLICHWKSNNVRSNPPFFICPLSLTIFAGFSKGIQTVKYLSLIGSKGITLYFRNVNLKQDYWQHWLIKLIDSCVSHTLLYKFLLILQIV